MGLVITTADAQVGSAGRLVGRVRERRHLDGLIESAEGGGAAALIVGEAGTGKTGLVTPPVSTRRRLRRFREIPKN